MFILSHTTTLYLSAIDLRLNNTVLGHSRDKLELVGLGSLEQLASLATVHEMYLRTRPVVHLFRESVVNVDLIPIAMVDL